MRLPLANTLKTRSGDHLKDARNVNGYPDIKEGQAIVRKRPGCVKTGFDFTTPLQGFSSIADLLQYMQYGSSGGSYGDYGDISTLMFSIYGDYYYIYDIYVPEYNPTAHYAVGDMVFINKTNYVFGETEEGEIWYALGDIDPNDERLRPNFKPIDPRQPRGFAWSKTKPGSSRYLGSIGGYGGIPAATINAAGYFAWTNYPYSSYANRTLDYGSWMAFAYANSVGYTPPHGIWCVGYQNNESLGVDSRGTIIQLS